MKLRESRRFYCPLINRLFAVSCSAIMLSLGQPLAIAQQAQSPATATTAAAEQAPKISNDQLDSLVAPIALYSDELLAQTEHMIQSLGAPFVPQKHEGVIYIRPPVS